MSRAAPKPRRNCPVCGASELLSAIRMHVGSAACLRRLHHERAGKLAHPSGAKVLDRARELQAALDVARDRARKAST
jgi:hypothetical protein